MLLILPLRYAAQNNNATSSYDPHDIKITGYLQTQFQKAQSPGITSFSGGNFPANSDNRFMISRMMFLQHVCNTVGSFRYNLIISI
ncbi:hypothetical protein [Chryseobacterium angstadtii]|uniref:hypothetical protein n=1 Tax=Chryseobacterium angstadtii TaxID=558151 RepID=UPI00103B7A71|nr:hypothetical protein [Chryseobacterium angstadtii]